MTDTARETTAVDRQATASASYAELIDDLRSTFDRGHTRSLSWRRRQLEALIQMLDENEQEFIDAVISDLGRPQAEAYLAEVAMTKTEVSHMIKNLKSWTKPKRVRLPLTSLPGSAKVIPEPLGVALVIAPWNYPIQLLLIPVAAAIAAGNCVVAKPSELSPTCSAALARLMPKYLDDSAISVAEGAVAETTALLEQRFDHIFFTGSTNVGRIVMQAAAKHLTPVVLELGGKSPVIVTADADLDVAARRIIWGRNMNAGQTCVAPDYVLVESSVRDELVDKMAETIGDFFGDDPKASSSLGRIVNQGHYDRVVSYLEDHGGTLAIGGSHDRDTRYVEPTVIVDPDPDSALMTDEIFGPVLPVLSVEDVDEAIRFVRDRPKPLALYMFSSSDEAVDEVLTRTSSGGVCVNGTVMQLLPQTLPFGGVGASGMGAYHGKAGFDAFSHYKSVLNKPTRPDPSIMYPPYTKLKEKLVRKVM
jgi:aldehyde dehydrogenase (NAD+)